MSTRLRRSRFSAPPPSSAVGPSIVLVPADLVSLGVVRAALERALGDEGWDAESAARVVLAVAEAAANAVEHGSDPGALVEVNVRVRGAEARVRVVDSGRADGPHPPAVIAPPPPDALRGRGLVIMQGLAQHLEVRSHGGGTEVIMDFHRRAA